MSAHLRTEVLIVVGSLKKIAPGSAQRVPFVVSFFDAATVPGFGGNYLLYLEVERVP